MENILLALAAMVSLSAYAIGAVSIIKGKFRPQRMTRFLLLLISLLFVGTLLAQGDTNAIWLALAAFMGTLSIFILSIKRGIGGSSKLDIMIFLMVIVSLVVWYTTKNPVLGLIMSIVTDFIAFSPTLIKAWVLPETEEWRFYVMDVISSFLIILSLSTITLGNAIFPIYIFLINLLVTSVILIRGRNKLKLVKMIKR